MVNFYLRISEQIVRLALITWLYLLKKWIYCFYTVYYSRCTQIKKKKHTQHTNTSVRSQFTVKQTNKTIQVNLWWNNERYNGIAMKCFIISNLLMKDNWQNLYVLPKFVRFYATAWHSTLIHISEMNEKKKKE